MLRMGRAKDCLSLEELNRLYQQWTHGSLPSKKVARRWGILYVGLASSTSCIF